MNVGVIGAGNIAKAAHLPALKSIPTVNVVGIADVDERRAKKIAKRFHISQYYSDFEELIDQDSIQLIHLCTPPQIRLQIIESAAAKGKNLFVEKPLALTLDEAIRIRRVVRKHGVALTVVQNYRCFPSVQDTKRRIAAGYLGNIVSMQGTGLTPHPANQSKATHFYHPGGVLFDFAPHLIDMLLWFNGSAVEKVFAFGGDYTGRMGFINYAQILLYFANKAVAVADVSWLTAIEGMRFTINIHGTGGHILLNVRNDTFTEFHGVLSPIDDVRRALAQAFNVSKGVLTGAYFTSPFANYKQLILDFLDAVRNSRAPSVTIEQAVMTIAVLEAAQRSILDKRPIAIRDLFASTGEFEEITRSLNHDIPRFASLS
jgi:predicted dehydrogenase